MVVFVFKLGNGWSGCDFDPKSDTWSGERWRKTPATAAILSGWTPANWCHVLEANSYLWWCCCYHRCPPHRVCLLLVRANPLTPAVCWPSSYPICTHFHLNWWFCCCYPLWFFLFFFVNYSGFFSGRYKFFFLLIKLLMNFFLLGILFF